MILKSYLEFGYNIVKRANLKGGIDMREIILEYNGVKISGKNAICKRIILGSNGDYVSLSKVSEKIKVYDAETNEDITNTIHPVDRINLYIGFSENR